MPRGLRVYIFILPALLFMFIFLIFPLATSFYLSFTEYNYAYSDHPKFIALGNYLHLLQDANFVVALRNTMYYFSIFFPGLICLSLGIAILLNQKIRGTSFFTPALLLPTVVPLTLAGVAFIWILSENFGIVNHILKNVLGMSFLTHSWLVERETAMISLAVVGLWKYTGFAMILFLAGLQAIPETLYDAAKMDGANSVQIFSRITLPNLKESFILVGIWGIIQSVKVFEQAFVMTKGGPGRTTLVLYLYAWKTAFRFFEMGYAASIAYIIGIIILVLAFINFALLKTERM